MNDNKFSLITFSALIASLVVTLAVFPSPIMAGEKPPSLILVRGTASTPDTSERNYAERVTTRLSGWLRDLNIRHGIVDDETVAGGSPLERARVAIFCYNPYLPRKELRALRRFVQQGGKLIVFYSSDARLATLMQMKVGRYRKAGVKRQWHSFSFNKHAPGRLPRTVFQISRNIKLVYPAGRNSKVIAFWEDASGIPLSDPAWVQSDHGFWMTHVLQDGDVENKKAMLLGMIGMYEPSVWHAAAQRYHASSGKVAPFRDLQDALRQIPRQVRGSFRTAEVRDSLSRASVLSAGMDLLFFEQKKYYQVIEQTKAVERLLIRAYARAQQPRRNEFRGVWDHTGTGLYPGNWEKTCRMLANHGITAIFPNIIRNGIAHYKSDTLGRSDIFSVYGDQVHKCLDAAKKYGIQVHVWKICWRMDNAPRAVVRRLKKQKRLQLSSTGETINWLCPSDPRNLEFELANIRELAQYPVHGIHLDYNRYRDGRFCYCLGCKKRFEKRIGRGLRNWPGDVRKEPLKKQYQAWRCEQTERLIMAAARAVRAVNPEIRLSAAVFGGYPGCVASVGQDWVGWLKKGHADFVCPMNYTAESADFSTLVRNQLALSGVKGRVIPGIGVTSAESQLTPAQVIEQILIVRRGGAAGYILFQLGITLQRETLPALRLGVTAPQ